MTRRFRAREVALQLLFQRDANADVPRDPIEEFARGRLRDPVLVAFCLSLFDGVSVQQAGIDAKLTAAAENWRLPRMANADRNVLRLGAYELLFPAEDAPAPVVLDEAIELARRYGSKDSPGFVNGVLDKVFRTRTEEQRPVESRPPSLPTAETAGAPAAVE